MTNRRQWFFLCLAALGTVLPLAAFAPFVVAHGLDVELFIHYLWLTPVSRFFVLDVLISAITFFLLVYVEGRRLHMKYLSGFVICTMLVGVSLGLPLFLYFRELKQQEVAKESERGR